MSAWEHGQPPSPSHQWPPVSSEAQVKRVWRAEGRTTRGLGGRCSISFRVSPFGAPSPSPAANPKTELGGRVSQVHKQPGGSALQDAHPAPAPHRKGTAHLLSQGPLGGFLRPAARAAPGKTSYRRDYGVGTVSFLSPGAPCCAFISIPWSRLIHSFQMPAAKILLSHRGLRALG